MRPVGETTITGKNQVSLPARGLRELDWERGDQLLVEVLGTDMLVLIRRPKDSAGFYLRTWVSPYRTAEM
jgi:bifunctional DNA-binding transcriptional regulator/antitoxin component of YhaV-PrlF toxin-antitoxin module